MNEPAETSDHPHRPRERSNAVWTADLHKKWLEENAEAIRQYNERVDREGVWNEGLRRF